LHDIACEEKVSEAYFSISANGMGLRITGEHLRRKHFDSYDLRVWQSTGVDLAEESILMRLSGCPYRKLDPDVLMVQPTKHRLSFDTPVTLNGPSIGRILP
jgi:hypothetical protein